MSSPSDAIAGIIEEYSSLTIASYCSIAAAVLVLYDYVLTLGEEVMSFWNGKLRAAHVMFFLNRFGVVYYLMTFSANAQMSDQVCRPPLPIAVVRRRLTSMRPSCAGTAKSSKAIGLVLFLPWAAFAGLRVYALSKRWILAALVFLLSVVPLCVNAVVFKYGVTGINVPMMGCVGTDSMPRFLAQRFTIVSRTCLIAADCILIYLTWSQLPTPRKNRVFRHRISLIDVLLRDGTIYFVVLLVLNVLHLVFTLLSTNVVAFQNTSFIPIFTQPLTTNLVSRFLLDLQAADRAVRDQVSSLSSTTLSRNSTVMFRERPVDSVACSIPLDDYHSEHEHHPGSNLSDSWEIR